jgi:uncharacterized membrane protein YjjP (DUF1212 family)
MSGKLFFANLFLFTIIFSGDMISKYLALKALLITNEKLYNFQIKLRSVILGSDLSHAIGGATENTMKNASVIIVILPFMIIIRSARSISSKALISEP